MTTVAIPYDHSVFDPARLRLRLRPDLKFIPRNGEKEAWVLEDPIRGKFFEIGPAEKDLLLRLRDDSTLADAIASASTARVANAFSEHEALVVCRWAFENRLVLPADQIVSPKSLIAVKKTRAPVAFNPLSITVATFNPNAFLARLAPRCRILWTSWGFAAWLLCGIVALHQLFTHWSSWVLTPDYVLDSRHWLRLLCVWIALKLLHECAHGVAAKHFGLPVRRAGVILMLLAPVAYVDVTSAWRLPSKWQRIVVSAAGMYAETFVAFLAMICWTPHSNDTFDRLMRDISSLALIQSVLFNANPLMRLDGYFMLSDCLNIPNLYGTGRRQLSEFIRHWFGGVDVASRAGKGVERYAVWYGLGSLLWQIVVYFGIAVALVARWRGAGTVAAIVVGLFWLEILPRKKSPGPKAGVPSLPAKRRRRISVIASVLLATLCLGWLLSSPQVAAPGVVEYAPLHVLRAEAGGFVSRVHVTSGQTVEAGTLLVELVNEELQLDLINAEVELQQAELRGRSLLQNSELTRRQAELSKIDSLRTRKSELESRIARMQVHAPCRATVISTDVEALPGRYFERGETVLLLGNETEKEIVVSIDVGDESDFETQRDETVSIMTRGISSEQFAGKLVSIEPQARESLPHEALGAHAGGEVVVKQVEHASSANQATEFHAIRPRLTAKVTLDRLASEKLSAGRRVRVTLQHSSQTVAQRYISRMYGYLVAVTTQQRAEGK